MHSLDSRSLSLGNCFGQKFPAPGDVRYIVTAGQPLSSALAQDETTFHIHVLPAAAGTTPQQHDVIVGFADGKFNLTPPELEVHAGDGVLWHTTTRGGPGFQVSGQASGFSFTSAHLRGEAIYTHAFAVPGLYEWHDPHGGGASGTVQVSAFEAKDASDRDRWFELLKQPITVEIHGNEARPSALHIVLGQTVFFIVKEGDGIAITDKRLTAASPIQAKS